MSKKARRKTTKKILPDKAELCAPPVPAPPPTPVSAPAPAPAPAPMRTGEQPVVEARVGWLRRMTNAVFSKF